ncbi:hypothetical protein COCMIDRAFT_23319 [Bipolaris oryzae ATCC 44560]|uniref:DUF7730 domain-containing protein n=1 Tax=Bipolaris oryzae ATCC 44560 TaxID=930090 RepID=W6ZFY5_COCMI|nr:uncharacterized protein COCMIDRAFT_23319 [Bipolaris oryzae ATCC 44560]EUC48945.1 hypothetical protein COCMIDRAFT_23319 [Bipolaris oryzae ATCC 44560]
MSVSPTLHKPSYYYPLISRRVPASPPARPTETRQAFPNNITMGRLARYGRKLADFLNSIIPAAIFSFIYQFYTQSLLPQYVHSILHNFILQRGTSALLWRILEAITTFLLAPHHFPRKLWLRLHPPPCTHHRCQLQRYVSPPPPPPRPCYMYMKRFCQPIRRLCNVFQSEGRSQQDSDTSAFLRLPTELRCMIYDYASGGGRYGITSSRDIAAYDPQEKQREDAVSYVLGDDAIIAIHGSCPSINLLLVCRRVCQEAREHFFSTTVFELHPLTPSDGSWVYEYYATMLEHPAYEYLPKSLYVRMMRKARLRVDIARFSCYRQRQPRGPRGRMEPVAAYDEIDLKNCTEMLLRSSRRLCEILKTAAPNLRVVDVHWVDDFPHAVSECDMDMRASVLRPFCGLDGVTLRVKQVVMAGNGKEEVFQMIKSTFV